LFTDCNSELPQMPAEPLKRGANAMRRSLDWLIRNTRRSPLLALLAVSSTVLGVLAIVGVVGLFAPAPEPQVVLAYGDFKEQVKSRNVIDIWTTGYTVEGDLRKQVRQASSTKVGKAFRTTIPSSGDPALVGDLELAGVQVNPPRTSFFWDFVASAPAFSTLAAVLAGFVIIAIVAILTFPPEGSVPKHIPLAPLLTAFLSLVVASFLFAVMAGFGTTGTSLASHAEGFCLSWILALGVVQTCVGVTWLLMSYDMPPEVLRPALWIVDCTVGVAAAATSGVLVLPLYELYGSEVIRNGVAWVMIFGVLLLSIPIGHRWRAMGQLPLIQWMTFPALIAVLAIAAAFGALTALGGSSVRDAYAWAFGSLVVAQLALGALFAAYEAGVPLVLRVGADDSGQTRGRQQNPSDF
jgi:hypothetical protein